jgi:hypothetical protein
MRSCAHMLLRTQMVAMFKNPKEHAEYLTSPRFAKVSCTPDYTVFALVGSTIEHFTAPGPRHTAHALNQSRHTLRISFIPTIR